MLAVQASLNALTANCQRLIGCWQIFSLPDVSWFKGHQPISTQRGMIVSANGRVLHIERAKLSDAGSYRCVATNVAGSAGLQYGLRVNGEWPELQGLRLFARHLSRLLFLVCLFFQFVCPFIHVSIIQLYIHPSAHLLVTHLSLHAPITHLCIHPFTHISTHLPSPFPSIHLFTIYPSHPLTFVSIHLATHQSLHPFTRTSTHLSTAPPFTHLSIHSYIIQLPIHHPDSQPFNHPC